MKTKKFIAFIAAVVITAGAITTGTILLLRQPDKKPSGAMTVADFTKPSSSIPARFLPSTTLTGEYGYSLPYDYYIEFGEYPQTHVSDITLLTDLNFAVKTGRKYLTNSSPSDANTQVWTENLLDEYVLNGEKFVNMPTPHPAGTGSAYNMSTGTSSGTNNLWFRVEPLRWFVTGNDGASLSLWAVNNVIGGIPLHSRGYTTYTNCGIRAFLNGSGTGTPSIAVTSPSFTIDPSKSFFQTAFNATAQSIIRDTTADDNTDKVYLLSSSDMAGTPFNTSGGSDTKRKAKPTDFALASGAGYASTAVAGSFWTRTASSTSQLWTINALGAWQHAYPSNAYIGVRPAIRISVPGLMSLDSAEALMRTSATYSYNLNGASGTVPAGGKIIIGSTITLPSAPSRTGYTFSGWGVNNASTKTHNAGATFAITGDTTIYAIWTPISYTITYNNLSGGVWVSGYTAPATYNIESVVTLPTSTNITRSGYILLRWHEGSATGAVVTVIPPGSTNNRAYCSEWGYTSAAYDTAVAAKQAIIDQLNGEKTTLTNEKTALQGQVTTLTNEKTALQEQVTTLTNEKGSLQTQLGNKIQELADKTKAYNDLWSDYQALLGASVEDSEEWAILKAGYDIQIAGLEADITQLNGQINTKDGQISALNGTITGLSTQIEGLNTAIGQKNARILELEDYIAAHENDYDIGYGYGYGDGYDDGFGNYVKEYGFVAWKILQSDEAIAGPLTTYDVYDNVKVEYGTQIQAVTLPEEKRIVYSKQYVYTFVGWSLTPQRGETPNTPVALPKADATNVVYYAQYKRTVRTYDIKWVIPIITEGQLDYNIPPEELEITTLAYGTIITTTPVAPGVLHGNVNYIFDGWSSTPYGVKIQPGVINGGRTFYARYIPKQTV